MLSTVNLAAFRKKEFHASKVENLEIRVVLALATTTTIVPVARDVSREHVHANFFRFELFLRKVRDEITDKHVTGYHP
jgi:hypothetical protein